MDKPDRPNAVLRLDAPVAGYTWVLPHSSLRGLFAGHSPYTSRITGRINGLFDVCLLIYLFKSTRIFSLITDQSALSSRFEFSTVRATHSRAPASISFPFSLINPRVTISGADSTRPVCLSIAIIGITTPSSDK